MCYAQSTSAVISGRRSTRTRRGWVREEDRHTNRETDRELLDIYVPSTAQGHLRKKREVWGGGGRHICMIFSVQSFSFSVCFTSVNVGCSFRNIHPSWQCSSRALIHAFLYDFFSFLFTCTFCTMPRSQCAQFLFSSCLCQKAVAWGKIKIRMIFSVQRWSQLGVW